MLHAFRYCHTKNFNIKATEIYENKLDKFINRILNKNKNNKKTTTLIEILSTVRENNVSISNPLLSLFTVLGYLILKNKFFFLFVK